MSINTSKTPQRAPRYRKGRKKKKLRTTTLDEVSETWCGNERHTSTEIDHVEVSFKGSHFLKRSPLSSFRCLSQYRTSQTPICPNFLYSSLAFCPKFVSRARTLSTQCRAKCSVPRPNAREASTAALDTPAIYIPMVWGALPPDPSCGRPEVTRRRHAAAGQAGLFG